MLRLINPSFELYNDVTEQFITCKEQILVMEHSLLSIAKWEAKWHKPFLSDLEKDKKTTEEWYDYYRCMTINAVDPNVYLGLSDANVRLITEYINDTHTATTFHTHGGSSASKANPEIMTAELIYYYMTQFNIPFEECEKWHLNQLLTLIRVCGIKNSPSKKMSSREIANQNRALNAARRAKHHSKG